MPTKVLIVDDELAIRDMIGFALSKAGIDYVLAESAEEAEQCIDRSQLDLVLLDWMLPGISGIEFARHPRIRRPICYRGRHCQSPGHRRLA